MSAITASSAASGLLAAAHLHQAREHPTGISAEHLRDSLTALTDTDALQRACIAAGELGPSALTEALRDTACAAIGLNINTHDSVRGSWSYTQPSQLVLALPSELASTMLRDGSHLERRGLYQQLSVQSTGMACYLRTYLVRPLIPTAAASAALDDLNAAHLGCCRVSADMPLHELVRYHQILTAHNLPAGTIAELTESIYPLQLNASTLPAVTSGPLHIDPTERNLLHVRVRRADGTHYDLTPTLLLLGTNCD